MNTFVSAVRTQEARTDNGMKALSGTGDNCVNFFYKVGAMRGQNPIPAFVAALAEHEDLALRIALWARDVRGGAGERELFRQMLQFLESTAPELAKKLLPKVAEVGRWDDLFVFKTKELKEAAYTLLGDALRAQNGLAAKWTPRKGPVAEELKKFFGMSPKQYRKSLVELTKVVEQQMCAKDWDNINFSHVPSIAASRYKKAFLKNAPESYKSYIDSLVKNDGSAKINANAIFPHEVLKDILPGGSCDSNVLKVVTAQWDALPNYVGDAAVLAMVDVSGSMMCPAGGSGSVECLDIALSLGLYTADKNKGAFKDTILTFSSNPELLHLKGNISQKLVQMNSSSWGMSTNVISAFAKILKTAVDGNVPQEDMPKTLLIMSDMQFDYCARYDDSAMESVKRQFANAGYEAPNVVFWNLNDRGNVPVKADESGAALVSGYSPSIMTAILGGDDFSPRGIMLRAVMVDKYAI